MKPIQFNFLCGLVAAFLADYSWANTTHSLTDYTIPNGNMTIEQAFDLALQRNPRIDQIRERVIGAEATLRRAKSYLYPSVGISAGYTLADATQQPDWSPEIRQSIKFDQFSAGASLRWILFDGLQSLNAMRAVRGNIETARQIHKDAQRILLQQVSSAFLQSELAKEQMRIAISNYQFNQELQDNARIRFETGDIPEADVLNFSLALIEAEANFLTAKRDFESSCNVIAELLAIENAQLSEDQLPQVDFSSIDDSAPSYAEALGLAIQTRPDLKAVQSNIEVYEYQINALEGRYYPRVDLVSGFSYQKYNFDGTIDQEEHDTQIGLQASWEIFSGGRRQSEIAEVQATRRAQQYEMEQLLDSIASSIQQNLNNLETSYLLFQRQNAAEAHATKIRDYVEQAYLQGEVSITRLNEAQTNWVRASSGLSVAKVQILMHRFSLRSTTGEILQYVN